MFRYLKKIRGSYGRKSQIKGTQRILEEYKNYLTSKGYSKQTIISYEQKVAKFLSIHPDPSLVTENEIKTYLSELRSKNICLSYFENHFYGIRCFFEYLHLYKKTKLIIRKDVLFDLRPLHREKRVPKIIPNDDLSALLRAPDLKSVRGCRDYVIMFFLLHGLRAQEICTLTINQIFSDGWGPTRKMVIDVKGKGRKERRIVVERSGDTEWAWNRYLQMRNGYTTSIAFPALLGKGNSKQLTTNGLYKILSRYAQRSGITRWHPHLWRHTSAVRMIEEGIPLREIQCRLGHETISTTEKYLGAATILQEESANSEWIHNLKKADARFRRWRQ